MIGYPFNYPTQLVNISDLPYSYFALLIYSLGLPFALT
jgi:hypothetical protein